MTEQSGQSAPETSTAWRWIRTGDEAFERMTQAIDGARESIRFEVYIHTDTPPGRQILEALARAARRGVRVRALVDAFGSLPLSDSFWNPLRVAGGSMQWFNPLGLKRFNIRNHRKLLVVDDWSAAIGGFNIDEAWCGDGVQSGWRDIGLEFRGPVARELAASFDSLWERATLRHPRLARLRRTTQRAARSTTEGVVLLTGPGRGRSPLRQTLIHQFRSASRIDIIAAYFLPPRPLRRALAHAARRGASVRLILPGQSDVPLMQAATRRLYQRFLRAGVQVFEYGPQILHSKFVLTNRSLLLGSANLDPRSLGINYDFLVEFHDPQLLSEARERFDEHLAFSRRIDPSIWKRSRGLWARLVEWFALLLFTRLDPLVTRHQLRNRR